MSNFDTRKGTRGGRQPAGRDFRWMNKFAERRIRRTGGKMMGFNALVLSTVGRKSGLARTNPVGWFPGPDDSWLIVAAGAGSMDNPSWYYNLAANPDKVSIEFEGKHIRVTPEQLHGDERAEAWQQITTKAPTFAKYAQKTDRELPVIRLTDRSQGSGDSPAVDQS